MLEPLLSSRAWPLLPHQPPGHPSTMLCAPSSQFLLSPLLLTALNTTNWLTSTLQKLFSLNFLLNYNPHIFQYLNARASKCFTPSLFPSAISHSLRPRSGPLHAFTAFLLCSTKNGQMNNFLYISYRICLSAL